MFTSDQIHFFENIIILYIYNNNNNVDELVVIVNKRHLNKPKY